PNAILVAQFLRGHERRGLRHVALVDADGGVTASAGRAVIQAPVPRQDSATGRLPLIAANGRLRAYFPATVATSTPRGSLATVVIEFEPTASARLMAVARRSLALAVATSVILSLAAFVFFRISSGFETARLRLEQQRHLALLGEMSAVLAHEIRNPLASLKGHAQLAAERLADGSREKRCLDNVISDADRLDALTADLLSFARSSAPDIEPVNPSEILRVAVADVFDAEAVMIEDADAPAVWPMDAGRVRQALVNLLDNARKATADSRTPVARVTVEAGGLVFEVRDFGPGLPPGREDRIFDPFFTTRTSGTGLGLAVASRVAEMHGGHVRASNHADGGAVFRLTIPQQSR
ncbi:MAG TPA: ATP-binding protein, partial [Gemmatimonadaceae bacterium]|nr:ATP-binding protein [Gemmatimonadaceae bacterium]